MKNTTLEEIIAAKKERFPFPLGVALVPDRATHEAILTLTEVAFRTVQPLDRLKLSNEWIPHVSVFQNMFRDAHELIGIVERTLREHPLPNSFRIQAAPNDVFVWAGNRPFINHEVTSGLALFHDSLLIECITMGRDSICAGCPADHRPLEGLSPEQEIAYRETGYVFSGASSPLSRKHDVDWKAFTVPHFTIGVIDWTTRPSSEEIPETCARIIDEMRSQMHHIGLETLTFEKLAIFRVQPGGVYEPSAENTVAEFALAAL